MPSSLTNLVYHVIFGTKQRFPLINDQLKPRLYDYIGGVIRAERGILIEIGGIEEHVHILGRFAPRLSVAEMVRRIKGSSSHWVNEADWYERRFAWQRGYSAFSVSESMVERVADYIRRQKEHHRRISFEAELAMFYEKNGITFAPA
jgi:REP element-mobilizing transposase RayT